MNVKKRAILRGLMLGVLSAPVANALERYVPSGGDLNYQTIQEAILAAAENDVIIVQPGVYQETLTFNGANVRLTSTNPDDPGVVASTVIEGDGGQTVVTFERDETRETVLTGFTIRNGGGTTLGGNVTLGGGIYCFDASPSIVGNVIEGNTVSEDPEVSQGLGGGLLLRDSYALVTRNVFRQNRAFAGGALFVAQGAPQISDNVFENNTGVVGGGVYAGGGARVWNNTFVSNSADVGSQLFVDSSRPEVINNLMAHGLGEGSVYIQGTESAQISWIAYNNFWENEGSDVLMRSVDQGEEPVVEPIEVQGERGNISVNPNWESGDVSDFRLTENSACINAGMPGQLRDKFALDFGGELRKFSSRVDIGAHEYVGTGNFAPLAVAGVDLTPLAGTEEVTLDGSASFDPEGGPLTYLWQQVEGENVELVDSVSASPRFVNANPGEYVFALVVRDGELDSLPDRVRVTIRNNPPLANAGLDKVYAGRPPSVTLDGSSSLDPEGGEIQYVWSQVSGPSVELADGATVRPSFSPAEDGSYLFELVVNDGMTLSEPDEVVFHIGDVAPIADAGGTIYVRGTTARPDGSSSRHPVHSSKTLTYQWREVTDPLTDPPLTIEDADTATPTIRGLRGQISEIVDAEFELTVSDGIRTSEPDVVMVRVIPRLGNRSLRLQNSRFDPEKPTIAAFGGGNCDTGALMSMSSALRARANVYSIDYSRDRESDSETPTYYGYGDQLIYQIARFAPEYDQPIQVVGFSTGNMPAFDVAIRLNTVYRDSRFRVNRVTMLDSGCNGVRDYQPNIELLLENQPEGEDFWIDNYYSSAGRFRPGVYNVEFPTPPGDHSDPNSWYHGSWSFADGEIPPSVVAGEYFSVVGPGRYHQANTMETDYYLGWDPEIAESGFNLGELEAISPVSAASVLPEKVIGIGPDDGALVGPGEVLFSCEVVTGADYYQLVMGEHPKRLNHVILESKNPPSEPLAELPFAKAYWAIRAVDSEGSYSYSPPRLIYRDTDEDTLPDVDEAEIYLSDPDQADTDQDGLLDAQELVGGTNLLLPDSPGSYRLVAESEAEYALYWLAQPGRKYRLEKTASLEQNAWELVEEVEVPNGTELVSMRHAIPNPDQGVAFYRIVLLY